MVWFQTLITVRAPRRGFHLITDTIVQHLESDLRRIDIGMLHLFIQHTSASLTINENADPTVRQDFERFFSHLVPENLPLYTHTLEGPDDMPAHLKASLLGNSLLIPITGGTLNLGTWQGIYLCEHRNHPPQRRIVATGWGTNASQSADM